MPRTKRPISLTIDKDPVTDPDLTTFMEQGTALANPGTEEFTSRPKRVRRQTQRFTNTSVTTSTIKKSVKKRATGKGKGKAKQNDQQETADVLETSETPVNGPPKKARSKKTVVPKEEKRLAEFRSECPPKVMERAERVRTQRYVGSWVRYQCC
jgi:hypothetical protein